MKELSVSNPRKSGMLALILLVFSISSPLKAQDDAKEFRLFKFPVYFESGMGADIAHYRDFATSPLGYLGIMGVVPLSLVRLDEKQDAQFTLRNAFGPFAITYGEEATSSSGYVGNLRYSHCFRINNWSGDRMNIKLGGVYDLTSIVRMNSYLFNNALGYEFFGTLSASAKIGVDLSRREEVSFKILPKRSFKLKPRRRQLSFRLDVGIINSTLRNGFAYIGQDAVINGLPLFSDYQYKFVSGFRIGSRLDYIHYLQNQNAFRFSYIWDAYTSGGELPSFEMAHHILQFSLLFKLNQQ